MNKRVHVYHLWLYNYYNEYNYCIDLNQKAVSTHSSLTGLISHSMPEDDHQFLKKDQPRPHYR